MTSTTISVLADENGVIVLYALQDSLREDARAAIASIQKLGLRTMLLSGDRSDVVRQVAFDCGISDSQGGLSPADKHDAVKRLQADGATVVMVGDGMNDGPVLALADVSIAMGQGAPISQSRSDLLLMSNRLPDLAYAVTVARTSLTLIRHNLGWAILYNLIAVPAAVTGFLEPWHAALGMSLSSLLVVLNGLRLLALKRQERHDLLISTLD